MSTIARAPGASTLPLLPARPFRPRGFEPFAEAGWRLARAWPRDEDHLLLDLRRPDGASVAGQWFRDPERAAHVARSTPGARAEDRVVLQGAGADRRLRPLADLVAAPGHRLVAHRPERRAVLAAPDAFVKVLRPERLAPAAARARWAAGQGLGAPEVLGTDAAAGILRTRALPGRRLTDLLDTADAAAACERAGHLLARLASLDPQAEDVPALGTHGPREEHAVIARWTRLAAVHAGAGRAGAGGGSRTLPALPEPLRPVIAHRDLHDGQMLLAGDRIGVLDVDLLALAHPALDLANLLVHLELRAEQGLLADPAEAAGAVLEGARPDAAVRGALPACAEATRLRLRAVYGLRDPGIAT
ncbi:phosphotransferase [Brachybacterium subflavum]|uniref:phosphotransferase n=1 Tax=Brachybacterium subflavum TaxID=2585206 RepID=UPI0012665688|nr:phosphotransferase [Brachybacterium subflavum]